MAGQLRFTDLFAASARLPIHRLQGRPEDKISIRHENHRPLEHGTDRQG